MKYDEELETYKEDLNILTIPFQQTRETMLRELVTPLDIEPQDGTNKSVHNNSFQNMSMGNAVNISHNRSAANRSILDTSAQKYRNMSMLNAHDLANRPAPPVFVPPVPLLAIKDPRVPILMEEHIATTTVAYSPNQP